MRRRMKDIDWQILHELYETRNMTRAASRLYMTQPSLTKRLQSIEEEFHVQVARRTTKGIDFTPQGELLAKRAGEYLAFMERLQKELKELGDHSQQVIRIGSSYTYSKYVLSDLLSAYTAIHPDVRFEMEVEQSNLLFRRACDGEVDLAFIQGDYEGPVKQQRIGGSPGVILSGAPLVLEELPGLTRIDYRTNDRTRELFAGWWKAHFLCPLPDGMNAGYVDMAWQLAERGLGYTLCFLQEGMELPPGLFHLPMCFPDGRPLVRNTWFVYQEKREMTSTLRDFIRYIGALKP